MPTLVLIRHGQSAWNLENRFTGWWHVDVTEKGAEEARAAGKLMAERRLDFDCCFTSVQTRAIKTLTLALEEMGQLWLPIDKACHLNEESEEHPFDLQPQMPSSYAVICLKKQNQN